MGDPGGLLGDLQNAWNDVVTTGETVIHSVEDAVNKLVSLGVPYFTELPQLVQIIIDHGENPFTLIPKIVGKINAAGNDPVMVLIEVTAGIMSQGLEGYTRSVITKMAQPLVGTAQKHQQAFHSVTAIHQDTLTQVKTKLTNLRQGTTGSAPMEGDFADALDTNFASIETAMTSVTGPFGIQINDPWPWFTQNLDTIVTGLTNNLNNAWNAFIPMAAGELIVALAVGVAIEGVGEFVTVPVALVLIGVEALAIFGGIILAFVLELIGLLLALVVAEVVYQGVNPDTYTQIKTFGREEQE